MRAVVQRVKYGSVTIDGKINGRIERGFVVLLGIHVDDTEEMARWLAKKIIGLRIFGDEEDKMNLSLKDIKGDLLVISQFTLYGNCEKGNRPSFIEAGRPEKAKPLYEAFVERLKKEIPKVETGIFGADMKVELLNDGPVTVVIDSPERFNK